MPVRVQRRRIAGWTAPLDAQGRRPVYVGRGTQWGNPWLVTQTNARDWIVMWRGVGDPPNRVSVSRCETRQAAQAKAVEFYGEWLASRPELLEAARRDLVDRDLMCWCAESLPCHADVLLAAARIEVPS